MSGVDKNGRRYVTVDTGGDDDIWPGRLVTWLHVPRGGFGFVMPLGVKIIACGSKPKPWAEVEVTTISKGAVRRRVDAASLRCGWTDTTGGGR